VSLPSLLLVDDSDAILALERAILSGHYSLNTASNGREALEKVGRLQPAAVLLDLSMPEMDGDEVLLKMKADPATSDIPVIIISSEKSRAESCIGMGAEAFLAKPFRAEELLAAVASAMENARRRARVGSMLVLRMVAGEQEFALPLDAVREVLLQPALRPLPGGPAYLSEYVELRGAAVCVLDVARRLGLEHRVPLRERMLVIIQIDGTPLALCVDRVQDPEEFQATEIDRHVGGADHGLLKEGLIGMLRVGGHRALPLLDPKLFISRGLLRELPTMLRQGGVGQGA
jgi:CheY-like chemotaxis protein/chemotaxis signal transduction protein